MEFKEDLDSMDDRRSDVADFIDLKSLDQVTDLTSQIHNLPCCIRHDGECQVSDYFKPKKTGVVLEGLEVEEGSFRGRRLRGATVPVPDGYRGLVLERRKDMGKGKGVEASDENSSWEATAKFDNITYWNHDSFPSQNDALMRFLHWFPVADALHKPVTVEDLGCISNSLDQKL
ncbi:hypothetical protein H6P81_019674 [Aristolochia fimbriata]|uniref:Uncharacterized protein n=1 Tax=Aristolochia fimbriata TaxID=158543 RepID=A0AAV7DU41_ARIFI|nr:hypothetical protein H6P81_019674 [Aristolochia fimbriata]